MSNINTDLLFVNINKAFSIGNPAVKGLSKVRPFDSVMRSFDCEAVVSSNYDWNLFVEGGQIIEGSIEIYRDGTMMVRPHRA